MTDFFLHSNFYLALFISGLFTICISLFIFGILHSLCYLPINLGYIQTVDWQVMIVIVSFISIGTFSSYSIASDNINSPFYQEQAHELVKIK